MSKTMTLARATEFGLAWNSRDRDLVASFFADDGVYHASVGPDRLGKTYLGKEEIRKGAKAFFERFPDGRFENLKVVVASSTSSPTTARGPATENYLGFERVEGADRNEPARILDARRWRGRKFTVRDDRAAGKDAANWRPVWMVGK